MKNNLRQKYEESVIKLDKIKIVSSINNIRNINEDLFQSIIKKGAIAEQKYTMLSPYSLYIEADYFERELIIEFTGKLLKDDYPQLINKDTIYQCFQNINDMGLCNLDIEAIMKDGVVVKCDVCKDVDYPNCQELCNLEISKNVKTRGCKCRLTIYDKGREIGIASNRAFLSSLTDSSEMLDYFKGKVRFELNLNSMQQIRKSLNLSDTAICSVLNSSATPIWDFVDKIVDDNDIGQINSLAELKNMLLLEHCGGDLERVEALLRNYYSKGTHISQVMKPFRALKTKLSQITIPKLKEVLSNLLLLEIFIFFGMFIF